MAAFFFLPTFENYEIGLDLRSSIELLLKWHAHTQSYFQVLAKCGHRQFSASDFVAPEQLWPFNETSFDDKKMTGYTEKVDIWRFGHFFVCHVEPTSPNYQLNFKAIFYCSLTSDYLRLPETLEMLLRPHLPVAGWSFDAELAFEVRDAFPFPNVAPNPSSN